MLQLALALSECRQPRQLVASPKVIPLHCRAMSATFVWTLYRVSDEQAAAIRPVIAESQRNSEVRDMTRAALSAWRRGEDVLADQSMETAEAFARAFHDPWPAF